MFNNLLESSKELTQAGRKFKLDEINQPSEMEIEKPISMDLTKMNNPPPTQPMQKKSVEFDGMENWRSVLSESAPGPSRPQGGDAGDVVNAIMGMSESDVAGLTPSPGGPAQSNPNTDIDADVSNILSSL
jgi:hypothetical protein